MYPELHIRKRLLLLTISILALFVLVGVKVGSLTVFEAEELTQVGVKQWTREGIVSARRGAIYDTNGNPLCVSANAYIVYANPRQVTNAHAFAQLVAPILGINADAAERKLSDTAHAYVILKRQVDRETVDELRALITSDAVAKGKTLNGLAFDEDAARVYTQGAFLCQVLGLTNVDSVGQSGLEIQYEELLSGTPGKLITEVDARARALPDGQTVYVPPQQGCSLTLTVDAAIQSICEKALRECILVNNAQTVCCVAMDVNTGAILALAQKPDYDPNTPPRDDIETLNSLMRIRLISDVYEPGSTFKILTCASAIDCGVTSVNDSFFCTGSIKVDGDTIRCWKNNHGAETLAQALQNSCNPVFVQLALRMGADTFYKYLTAFGLGKITGVDLPGESNGIMIRLSRVKNVDLARIGFGQSIAVTPIQLLTAACAVVNGGRLMKPYIVKEVKDSEGNVISRTRAQVTGTPISEETSKVMRELLEQVVSVGGAKNAAITGYRIGGKTGTAQVYKDGVIASGVHIGSFLGFAPADHPRIALLVIVNEAGVYNDYGGTTAAPFARQIFEEVLPYLGIRREGDIQSDTMVTVPDVCGQAVEEAQKTLGRAGLLFITDDGEGKVQAQMPAPGTQLVMGSQVMLYTQTAEESTVEVLARVPNVCGQSVINASRMLREQGLQMLVDGSGIACRQTPAAGEYIREGETVTVTFQLP